MIYRTPFLVSQNTKLQWLQYRINHHILTTNVHLFRLGITESPYCSLCNDEIETIEHAFWDCYKIQEFYNTLEYFIDALLIPFRFNKETLLFGFHNRVTNSEIDNEIVLMIKWYIYKSRCLNTPLSITAFINHIKDQYTIQKFNIQISDNILKVKFDRKWVKWQSLLE